MGKSQQARSHSCARTRVGTVLALRGSFGGGRIRLPVGEQGTQGARASTCRGVDEWTAAAGSHCAASLRSPGLLQPDAYQARESGPEYARMCISRQTQYAAVGGRSERQRQAGCRCRDGDARALCGGRHHPARPSSRVRDRALSCVSGRVWESVAASASQRTLDRAWSRPLRLWVRAGCSYSPHDKSAQGSRQGRAYALHKGSLGTLRGIEPRR